MDQAAYKDKSIKELFMELARTYFAKKYKVMSDGGIYPGQDTLLQLVNTEPGLSQKDLAKKLNIQPPTVAVSIKRMEKAGWLKKEMDAGDKRISRIYITDKGQNALKKVKDKTKELNEVLFNGISEEEKCLLRRILIQLIENVKSTMAQNEMDEVMEQFSKHHEHPHSHPHPMHHKKD
ncbi:MarR family winged helix-turn-helix transcriptional regulator [Konateibacter massiliensis]|uniref:MarR family winged helix-turn-helix transcriptional regulator n=1 Tax=Konateibacter massiliensis TaxID=2002841 RepID=UPI000C14B011|nr:MarR family transcriptional regulator [Konateibacter massiliensis]